MKESSRTKHQVLAWRIAAGAAGIAATLACASVSPSEPSYQEQVSHWEGESEADLVTSWGMPQKTHALADGGRILEYRYSGEDESSCTTRFTLDRSGKIVKWWYAGVRCSAPKTG